MKKIRGSDIEGIRNAINLALADVGKELGMNIEARNCSYKVDSCKFQLHCELGSTEDRRKNEFMNAIHFASSMTGCEKLTADHYGTEFKSGKNTFVFDELAINRSAFPIGATKKGTDRHYKFRGAAAKLIIENANASN